MARVLVTGGTGFIGSALVRRLVARGDEVMVLRRHGAPTPRLAAVADRVRFLDADLAEAGTWRPALHAFAPERVFHAAWYAEPGKYLTAIDENLECLRTGLEFVRAVLETRQIGRAHV